MITARTILLIAFALLALLSLFISLLEGSTLITPHELYSVLSGQDVSSVIQQIVLEIRMPRVFCAFITGGLLALSGALMQVLLRNPLADPYILGVSSGAALTTLVAIVSGLTGYWLTGAAWAGSLVAIFIVLILSKRKKEWESQHILLTGVAVASGFSAFISLILILSPDKALRGMLFWLLGDLSYAHPPLFEAMILFVGLLISLALAKQLNIFVRGEKEAKALGINTARLKLQLYFLSALLAATAVTLAGCIGFIGLIVPHLFRMLCGYNHRYLLPGCVLLGGSLLTIADLLSRVMLSSQQLPVGMITAMIGIPVFLFLLRKNEL